MATIPAGFRGAAVPLAPGDLAAEAQSLRCSLAIIHAFSDIESGSSGFLSDGRPAALFEAHYFHKLTRGRFDASHPNISSPVWNRRLYGAGGAHQYDRLTEAMSLDRQAALQSCSVGRYQAMGFNYKMLGYQTVEDLWAAFCGGERAHLDGFGAFIRGSKLLPDLQANPPKFVSLAIGYNGAGEHANGYDTKLEAAWRHYVQKGENAPPSPVAFYARAANPSLIGNASLGAALLTAAMEHRV